MVHADLQECRALAELSRGGLRQLLLIGCAGFATAGCATGRVTPPTHAFLERNYVFVTPSDTSLMYEAQAVAHIFLVDQLADAQNTITRDPTRKVASASRLYVSPMFRVRQLYDSSAAVRTPSFMPKILTYEHDWVGRAPVSVAAPWLPFAVDAAWLAGYRITLAHHSNGQAGCFRAGFVPDDVHSTHCHAPMGLDTSVIRLNRADGDFSTTYLSLAAHGTKYWLPGTDIPRASVGGLVGLDWHLPDPIPGALSSEQRALYGSWRLKGSVEGMTRRFLSGRTRVTIEGELAPAVAANLQSRLEEPITNYRWSVELSHSSEWLLGAGPFIRWNDGQDYYNIGFWKRRRVFSFGIMLDVGGDRFGAKVIN